MTEAAAADEDTALIRDDSKAVKYSADQHVGPTWRPPKWALLVLIATALAGFLVTAVVGLFLVKAEPPPNFIL